MPTTVSDSSVYTGSVVVPNDGELITGADRLLTAQALANRTRYLKDNGWATRPAVFRSVPLSGFVRNQFAVPAQYQYASVLGSMRGVWVQLDVGAAVPLMMDLDVPPGATLTQINAAVDGDAGGSGAHGALPATMPALTLFAIDPVTGVPVTTDTQSDTAPNAAAYDAGHLIVLAVSRIVDQTKRYVLQFSGETGANSQLGLTLTGIQLSWTAP